jgi:hypothetical protein
MQRRRSYVAQLAQYCVKYWRSIADVIDRRILLKGSTTETMRLRA